ncbi:MAG: translation elongation factor Ts [Coriobacteriia bacterium]|nr:translation elongation factor Ts [Coriobacteriia bacterium]
MAAITAQLVKELREMTGAGMMECKKALEEADGSIEAAVDVLRTRGLAAAQKKAGRATNEGLIVTAISDDGLVAAIAEVNCETDFVSRNEVFQDFAQKVVDAVLAHKPQDIGELLSAETADGTVSEMVAGAIHTIGENIQISRCLLISVETGYIASYIHAGGRLGVLLALSTDDQAAADNDEIKILAKDIAMQIAAANPSEIAIEDFDLQVIERELSIYKIQAEESGRPENIQEMMVQGRLDKFYNEFALLEQDFIKEPDKTIKQVIEAVAKKTGNTIKVVDFVRYLLGDN